MADVKWIKIVTDVFDDEKIMLIETMPDGDTLLIIWFKLLVLAGKQNNCGVFIVGGKIPYTDEMFATIFRRPLQTVRLALTTFERFGMVEIVDNTVSISNWEKHQSIDTFDKIREDTRKRVAKHREKQKNIVDNAQGNVTCNVTVTQCNATEEEEEEEEEYKNKNNIIADKPQKIARFIPPTVEEVKAYCEERKNGIDPEYWINHYTANGWKVGRNPMKDWKATVRTWERNGNNVQNTNGANSGNHGTGKNYGLLL